MSRGLTIHGLEVNNLLNTQAEEEEVYHQRSTVDYRNNFVMHLVQCRTTTLVD